MFLTKLKIVAAFVLVLGVFTGGAGLLARQVLTAQRSDEKRQDKAESVDKDAVLARAAGQKQPRANTNGDPLPAGATARLGRSRLRHGSWVQCLAYSPTGKLVVSAGGSRIKLWDTATGRLVRELPGHNLMTFSLAFSPSGKLLASGGGDRMARLWDVETGKQVQVLRCHLFGYVGAVQGIYVAFTTDGASLICGGHQGVIQVWDVATGKELRQVQAGQLSATPYEEKEFITALAVSPDGHTVAACSQMRKIFLWDMAGKKPPRQVAVDTPFVRDVKFSPDGKTLAWCGTSGQMSSEGIGLYELATDQLRGKLRGHPNGTSGIAFRPDGRRVASAGYDNTIKIWDLGTGKESQTLTGHPDAAFCLAFSPDGAKLASGGNDGSVRLWDTATGKELLADPQGDLAQVIGLALMPDGQTVLTGNGSRRVRLWDLATGRLRRTLSLPGAGLESLAFSPDAKMAAVASGATVDMCEVATGKRLWSRQELRPLQAPLKAPTTDSLVFSRDGKRLASSTSDLGDPWRKHTVVRIWDVATGKLLTQLDRPRRVLGSPVWSPDGATLALNEWLAGDKELEMKGLDEKALRVFEADTGKLLREFKGSEIYGNATALSPNGKLLATATSFNQINFWDAATGERLYMLQGPRSGANLTLLAFSPDGNQIAVAADYEYERQVVQVWDIARAKMTHEFALGIKCLCFSPDGKKLVTGQEDGTALVWDLTAMLPPRRKLSRQELEQRWARLGFGFDSTGGNQGSYGRTDALVEGGDGAVAFLEEKLLDPDLEKKNREEARRLAAPLANPERKVREPAKEEIMKYGDEVYLAVRNLAEGPPSPEGVKRIENLLVRNFGYRRSSSAYVLRQIGTLRARRLLDKLAQGAQDTPEHKNLALQAQFALDYIKKLRLPE